MLKKEKTREHKFVYFLITRRKREKYKDREKKQIEKLVYTRDNSTSNHAPSSASPIFWGRDNQYNKDKTDKSHKH